jgi:hypothetical protein
LTFDRYPGIAFWRDGAWESGGAVYSVPAGPSEWIAGDIDGDGRPDLVVLVDHRVVILRNASERELPPPPSPPADFAFVVEPDGIFLEWTRAPEAIARGVTYNVRVGTQPGLGDVVAPLSLASGQRLVPAYGNAGISPRRRVTGLEVGRTYYAAVQGVDAGGRGGPFSEELTIVPTVRSLTITAPESVVAADVAVSVDVPFTIEGAVGAVDLSAAFAPRILAPSVAVEWSGDGKHGVAHVRFGSVVGRGTLTLVARDASRWRVSGTVAVSRGDPGPDVALAMDRVVTTAVDHPVLFNRWAAALPPGSTLVPGQVAQPEKGVIQYGFPDDYYFPPTGFAGTDRITWVFVTESGERMAVHYRVVVAGTAGDRAYVRGNGTVDLLLVGRPTDSGVLETSEDLAHWRPVTRYRVPGSGTLLLNAVGTTTPTGAGFFRRVVDSP